MAQTVGAPTGAARPQDRRVARAAAAEPNVMLRGPRRPGEPVMTGFLVMRTFLTASLMTLVSIGLFLYEYAVSQGSDAALMRAQTMAVTTVIFFQIFYMLNCRSLRDSVFKIDVFSHPTVFVGIGGLLLLQTAFVYAHVMQELISTAPLSLRDVVLSLLAGMIILPVTSIEKLVRNRALGSQQARSRGVHASAN